MPREIQHFTATIPANTPVKTPVTVNIPTSIRVVTRIDWRVPPGPMGVFGWQVAMGGIKLFPSGGDTYVVADGQSGTWEFEGAPDGGSWQVIGYNTGANAHSVALAFWCDLPERPVTVHPWLPPLALMPAPDLSHAGPPLARP